MNGSRASTEDHGTGSATRTCPFVFRPVRESDLAALTDLVGRIADGLTSLPEHPDFLEKKIHESLRSFYPKITTPGPERYLFVLEDTATGKVVGTSGLIARVGGFDPFYTYEIRTEHQVYPPLGIDARTRVLHLKKSHKGPSEISSLFLHPDHRRTGWGKTLSLARFLFMRQRPERFEDTVIAELRGYIGPDGKSPFWEAVGSPFFRKDYYTADILSGLGEKAFIEALMPRHPVYVCLLPEAARSVIGLVHPETLAARRLLEREGFRTTNEVDIFDAGPLLKAEVRTLRTVRAARTAVVNVGQPPHPDLPRNGIVANTALDFRAVAARLPEDDRPEVVLTPDEADLLGVVTGDTVTYALFRPTG
ncbi:MAG: arginine N-succinyltransferase [Opitutales bacterium]|nr:arginine N-succinyltransferase [Opitutales bacterium]